MRKALGLPQADAPTPLNLERERVANIEALVAALRGRFARSAGGDLESDPGGSPRAWRTPRGLDLDAEADAVDLAAWARDPSPALPRVTKRRRPARGGCVAVLRDISSSMFGERAKWASSGGAEIKAQSKGGRVDAAG